MKKLLAIVLSISMLLCTGAAFAEAETEATETEAVEVETAETAETEAVVINWADIEAQGAETIAQGEFVTFDAIALKMWIPTAMPAVELTDEDIAQGYIGYYMTEDSTAAISVCCYEAGDLTLEDYKAQLPELGATDIEDIVLNGMSAVSYTLSENDTLCMSIVTEDGYLFEVAGSPVSDEGFASLLSIMMSSIQPAEVEVVE